MGGLRTFVTVGLVASALVVGSAADGLSAENRWPHSVVDGFSTPSGDGYWLVYEDGTVEAYDGAPFLGDASGLALTGPLVGGAASPDGSGYWLVARDGGLFTYGSAEFHGSMGGTPLNEAVFSMTPTESGSGYWLVARDGGVFSFGDADFYGALGDLKLNEPIAGITGTPTGAGYRLVARDGGVFAFGEADFFGGLVDLGVNRSDVVAMAPTPSGNGYWVARSNGEVHAFGDAPAFDAYRARSCDPVAAVISNPADAGYRLVLRSGQTLPFGPVAPGSKKTSGGAECADRLPVRRPATVADPLRVMVLGDSMAISLQAGVDTALRDAGGAVGIPLGKYSYGLTSSWPVASPCRLLCETLPKYSPASLTEHVLADDPDVVVLVVGLWDRLAARVVGGVALLPGTRTWQQWYQAVQDDAILRLSERGAIVYWVPYVECTIHREPERLLANQDAWAAAARHPDRALYLDLNEVFCVDGEVQSVELPDARLVTPVDFLSHFSDGGALWIGYEIHERLTTQPG